MLDIVDKVDLHFCCLSVALFFDDEYFEERLSFIL